MIVIGKIVGESVAMAVEIDEMEGEGTGKAEREATPSAGAIRLGARPTTSFLLDLHIIQTDPLTLAAATTTITTPILHRIPITSRTIPTTTKTPTEAPNGWILAHVLRTIQAIAVNLNRLHHHDTAILPPLEISIQSMGHHHHHHPHHLAIIKTVTTILSIVRPLIL